jgi:hypothetical protein
MRNTTRFTPGPYQRGQYPLLLARADYNQCCFAILVNGVTQLTRSTSNADLAWSSFQHFAKQHPGRTLLIFSQSDRDGNGIFDDIVGRA